MHRQASRHDDGRAAWAAYLYAAVRSLETSFPSHRVPGFRTRMNMRRGCHAGRKDCFHVLRRVLFACGIGKRTNFSYTISMSRPPLLVFDSHQPDLVHRLENRAARPFVGLCFIARGIDVQVPEHRGFLQLPDWVVGYDPAPYFLGSLAHGLTYLAGNAL